MKGLELSEQFFKAHEQEVIDLLKEDIHKVSIGLCGQGSECFGFDDEISRDHDFGPGFCIFLDDEMEKKHGEALKQFYEGLPKEFMGISRNPSSHGQNRVGIINTREFYFASLSLDEVPKNPFQWYQLSEERLAMATNGRLFYEGEDLFMEMRRVFQGFYPKDVVLKKLASRFALMAQAGQYNYGRCLHRGDMVASQLALSLFLKNAMSALYLLHDRYMPFYKWSFRGLKALLKDSNLPMLLEALAASNQGVALIPPGMDGAKEYDAPVLIEALCGEIAKLAVKKGYLKETVAFLEDGVLPLQEQIEDPLLRKLPLEQ